jgi:dTDP-4-amino-4,6-dideoxygalactose transaminase
MFRVGQPEIDAFADVVRSGKIFRYGKGGQCDKFEGRYAKMLGVKHAHLTSSGTTALTAALAGLGLGPGDEVIVPAHTYMATAIAVVAVGAIPVIVDVDESITLDPAALADAVGPRTRGVIPVHMWGTVCDMDSILRIARRRKLFVVEDACQCVGGAYEGRPAGSIGHAGAFSFNYFKNMTCGEGGAVVTNDKAVAQRAACMVDCCSFYWSGRQKDFRPFCSNGSRPSEFEGAILNAQLDQLPGMIRSLRRMKKRVLRQTAASGLRSAKAYSPDHECASNLIYQLPTAAQAQQFVSLAGGAVLSQTGRHTYTEWDPILDKAGGHHPAMNPFRFPQNKGCRMNYTKDMCPRTLEILGRTVMIGLHPDRTAAQVDQLIEKIRRAAQTVLGS